MTHKGTTHTLNNIRRRTISIASLQSVLIFKEKVAEGEEEDKEHIIIQASSSEMVSRIFFHLLVLQLFCGT
jgi:hypothetical protein